MTPPGTHDASSAGAGDQPPEDVPEVGTLAEEAARLIGALSGWAGDRGDLGPRVDDLAARASGALHDAGLHAAGSHEGGPDCSWCPVCRTADAVRSLSPEVRGHLASAATSLVHAAAALLATPVPEADDRAPDADADPDAQEEPA